MMHELEVNDNRGLFATVTYSPEWLPANGSLQPEDMGRWLKRFRKAIAPRRIRYYLVGEYGGKNGRPHYHAILFNAWIEDLDTIRDTWGMGRTHAGIVTYDSCRYVADYVFTKQSGFDWHKRGLAKPFQRQSIGLGRDYMMTHRDDLLNKGYVSVGGHHQGLPLYYQRKLGVDPHRKFVDSTENLKKIAEEWVKKHGLDQTRPQYWAALDQHEANVVGRRKIYVARHTKPGIVEG